MKIGIIIYSNTGNTNSVALKLQEKLTAGGHSVSLEQLKITGEWRPGSPGLNNIRLETIPDTAQYDALIFGAPVQGFSLSPVMTYYLQQISALRNKQIACLVTQAFPYPWMGGNQSMGQMKRLCESKDATVCGTGIVNWMNKKREQQISNLVEEFYKLF